MDLQDKYWSEKVIAADAVWKQVKNILERMKIDLPKTLRRPDIRLIVNNTSGQEITFQNPGDHSGGKPEIVPGEGDDTAAMIMLAGDTLADQQINAHQLTTRFQLAANGLTQEFVAFLGTEEAQAYIVEAYGPAPFAGQVSKLAKVEWKEYDGKKLSIHPEVGTASAFGARPAAEEKVVISIARIAVKGTKTVPEFMDNRGIVIAISEDWQTGEESTRPIVPEVAQGFYGEYYTDIPKVYIDIDGRVATIDLMNGSMIKVDQKTGVLTREYIDTSGATIAPPQDELDGPV